MAKQNAPIKDTVVIQDPKLHLKWSGPRIVRDAYTPLENPPGVDCSNDPGLTDQSQAAECDVNYILRRAMQSGVLPGHDVQKVFADLSGAVDYHEAQNIILNAQAQFNALNASARKKFDNNPELFLAFAENPANASEMVALGLAIEKPPIASQHPVSPPAGQPAAPSEPIA